MNIQKAINAAKSKLIKKANKTGLYENFGQSEVRKIEDKYIDLSDYTNEMNQARTAIQNFDNWCMNYTG